MHSPQRCVHMRTYSIRAHTFNSYINTLEEPKKTCLAYLNRVKSTISLYLPKITYFHMVKKKAFEFWKRLTRREVTEEYLVKNNNILITHLISLIGSKSELKKLYVQLFKKAYVGRNRLEEVAGAFIQECRIAKLLLSHIKEMLECFSESDCSETSSGYSSDESINETENDEANKRNTPASVETLKSKRVCRRQLSHTQACSSSHAPEEINEQHPNDTLQETNEQPTNDIVFKATVANELIYDDEINQVLKTSKLLDTGITIGPFNSIGAEQASSMLDEFRVVLESTYQDKGAASIAHGLSKHMFYTKQSKSNFMLFDEQNLINLIKSSHGTKEIPITIAFANCQSDKSDVVYTKKQYKSSRKIAALETVQKEFVCVAPVHKVLSGSTGNKTIKIVEENRIVLGNGPTAFTLRNISMAAIRSLIENHVEATTNYEKDGDTYIVYNIRTLSSGRKKVTPLDLFQSETDLKTRLQKLGNLPNPCFVTFLKSTVPLDKSRSATVTYFKKVQSTVLQCFNDETHPAHHSFTAEMYSIIVEALNKPAKTKLLDDFKNGDLTFIMSRIQWNQPNLRKRAPLGEVQKNRYPPIGDTSAPARAKHFYSQHSRSETQVNQSYQPVVVNYHNQSGSSSSSNPIELVEKLASQYDRFDEKIRILKQNAEANGPLIMQFTTLRDAVMAKMVALYAND